MIGRLTGKVLECSPGEVLLDVAGVGYSVQIPLGTFYTLSDGPGTVVSLHVHTHVREDALQLFGFETREERTEFQQLISISGVGPRMALSILSGIGEEELRRVVTRQDRDRLQKIPGVGKKTAERVLLELRDKLAEPGAPESSDGRRSAAAPRRSSIREDAISALVNLGYSRNQAARGVDVALDELGPQTGVQTLLRAALGGLIR